MECQAADDVIGGSCQDFRQKENGGKVARERRGCQWWDVTIIQKLPKCQAAHIGLPMQFRWKHKQASVMKWATQRSLVLRSCLNMLWCSQMVDYLLSRRMSWPRPFVRGGSRYAGRSHVASTGPGRSIEHEPWTMQDAQQQHRLSSTPFCNPAHEIGFAGSYRQATDDAHVISL